MGPVAPGVLYQMALPSEEFKKAFTEAKRAPNPELDLSGFDGFRAARAESLTKLRPLYPIPGEVPEVAESMQKIPARDGYEVPVKIYTPKTPPADGSPLIVMYHEGGWCMGDLTDEDLNCRMFARDLGAVCANVDYRLAPEHHFPTGVNDCWDVLKWLAANASSLQADPRRGFIVGGSSAGGNLSAVMSLTARDEKLDPPLTGQYLSVPATCPIDLTIIPEEYQEEMLSRTQNTSDPILDAKGLPGVTPTLNQDDKNWQFSPILHPDGHANLPPAYLQLAGMDPLRDDGLIYERILREKGKVPTNMDVYSGYGHMFWTNYPKMEKSKQFVRDTLEGFRWLLKQV